MKKILLSFLFILSSLKVTASTLETIAEKSNWMKTGRADEAERLCYEFQKKIPDQIKCLVFGTSPEGRKLHYMVIGNESKPKVWVQAGIHAGEIDGKDAVFWLLRRKFEAGEFPEILQKITLVFIPILNIDGHERFGKWNRPNQVGPEEMGWRVTSQNLNLNRDFLKADAPEMRDLNRLWQELDPVMSLDLHVTDGAQFQPEVGLIIHPNKLFGKSDLHQAGSSFEKELIQLMTERKHLALPFYPSFEDYDNPASGFAHYVSTPRFSQGYWYSNNRLGMLVETHSWKDYATRVKTHFDTVLGTLKIAEKEAQNWRKAQKHLDAVNLSGKEVDLEFKATDKFRMIDFPGYKYKKVKSIISGTEVIHYDPTKPEIWHIPLREELKASLTVNAPHKGYYIPPQEKYWLMEKLKVHHVKFEEVDKTLNEKAWVYRAHTINFSTQSYEGHQTLTVEGEWKQEKVHILKGSLFIPINQVKGRLVLSMFEPKAKDSFLSWGFLNSYFEKKEYMEDYVAQDVASEMLKDKKIKTEFEKKLKDPEFAKKAEARFEFFYRKHPSWDVNYGKYPVVKL